MATADRTTVSLDRETKDRLDRLHNRLYGDGVPLRMTVSDVLDRVVVDADEGDD